MNEPNFTISISKMTESHRITYVVVLDNNLLRPKSTSIFDRVGRITPFISEQLEHAQHEASEWAQFLGYPEQQICKCSMCETPEERTLRKSK